MPQFIDYFEKTWIGMMGTDGVRKAPLFALPWWNCHLRIRDNNFITNNNAEAFFRNYGQNVAPAVNPTLESAVEGLKCQTRLTMLDLGQIYKGTQKTQKATTQFRMRSLQAILDDYQRDGQAVTVVDRVAQLYRTDV